MLLKFKKIIGLLLVLAAARQTMAFSMLGPFETWQVPAVNFLDRWFLDENGGGVLRMESDTRSFAVIGFGGNPTFSGTVDIGGSKNLGDEYRLNTPIITYAFDASFLDYFGSNGVVAIDGAMAILNKLPAVSRASSDLSEYLTEGNQRINQRAQALNLIDLKSATLTLMLERMGLIGEEHVFDIHDRISTPGTCQFVYVVVERSFDPVTWEPSHYVNGTLYTYKIKEGCPTALADAVEHTVDNTGFLFTAAASPQGLQYGGFYLNVTRDDMGGLRYLYRHDNYNTEVLPTNSISTGLASTWAPISLLTNGVSSNSVALRGGIEKVTFVKAPYNSLLSTTFNQRTIKYTLPVVTNYSVRYENITRVITRPDIIFTAEDLSGGFFYPAIRRSGAGFASVSTATTPLGPGILSPQATITFNKMGGAFLNSTPSFLTEYEASRGFLWGSFDGTTNDPVVYGISIQELEQMILGY